MAKSSNKSGNAARPPLTAGASVDDIASTSTTLSPTTQVQAESLAKAAAVAAIAAEPAEPVVFDEQLITAYQQSALYSWKGFPRYNPDSLIGKKGIALYSDMMVDEQIKAVMNFRRDAVTARNWTLRYEEDSTLPDDQQKTRVDILTKLIGKMSGSFVDGLNGIMRALQFGYSITEKVYDFVDIDGKSYYYVDQLMVKPLQTFWFESDAYGRLVRFYQMIGGLKNDLDKDKFIIYVHNPEEDNFFGRSELRAAYRSWYSKDVIIRLWNLWMERMAGGFLAVTRTPDAQSVIPGSHEYAQLQQALSSITTTTSLLLPSGFDAKLLMPNNTDQFEKALQWHDTAIAKSQLVPNLLGISVQGQHGSQAQATTQLEAFAWTLTNIRQRLEDAINEQFICDMADQNWGDGDYPKFAFTAVTDAQLQWTMATWSTMVGATSVHVKPEDEQHIRRILDFPTITEEEIQALDDKKAQDALTEAKNQQMIKQTPAAGETAPGGAKFSARNSASERHTLIRVPKSVFNRALLRVDFAVIDRKAATIIAASKPRVLSAMGKAVNRLLGKENVQEYLLEPSRIGTLAFEGGDVSKIKAACKASLQDGWTLGTDQAQREIARAKKRPMSRGFSQMAADPASWLESNAFRMAGNLTDGSRSIIQQELLNAVKGNKTADEARDAILERLVRKGFIDLASVSSDMRDSVEALLQAAGVDTEKALSAYMSTLVRTNVFEAFNEARYELFSSPEMSDFIQALEYSAVLDDHTTEICSELDGSIWADDNEVWDEYRPPNHYNCRSILVPITTLDGWDGVESPEPTVQPQDGFK